MYEVGISVYNKYFRYLHGRGFCTYISHNTCFTKYVCMCKHLNIETSSQKSFIVRRILLCNIYMNVLAQNSDAKSRHHDIDKQQVISAVCLGV